MPAKTGECCRPGEEVMLIAGHCSDVLYSLNLEKMRWNYLSPGVEALTGYTVQEAMDRPLDSLLEPGSYLYFIEQSAIRLKLFLSDETRTHQHRDEMLLICRDGSVICCDVSSRCLRNGRGEITLAGMARKISERDQVVKELRASEERYREIINSIEEGYYECNLAGRLTFYNAAAARMLNYDPNEFSGISYHDLYLEPGEAFRRFNQVYRTGRADSGFTTEMLRRDGEKIHVEISITPLRGENGDICGFRGVARDVSERVKFQRQLEYHSMHDQLTGLYNRYYFEEEARRIGKSRDYPVTVISADLNGLKLINDTMGHEQGDILLQSAAEVMKDSLRGSDMLARVGGDEFAAILVNTCEKTAEKILERIRRKVKQFGEENPDIYLSISLGAATAQTSETGFTELFKQADDRMYRDKFSPSSSGRSKIVKSLLAALDVRDFIREGHAERLTRLCREMARRTNLSPRQQANLDLLAQVHDLGKVGIPDKILFKQGPLTEQEWQIMKQHPEKGYRIALSSNYLSGVAGLILKHHERWNGSGYPMGLKGREIPIECRILSIVDAFDAMVSVRPYSASRPKDEALAELRCCAGEQFDPDLVEHFEQVLNGESAQAP